MRDALLHLQGTTMLGATFEPCSGQILTLPGGSAPEWSLFSPGWPTSVIIRASSAQGQLPRLWVSKETPGTHQP